MVNTDYFRTRLDMAWTNRFEFLRRIPDVTIWKSLSYVESLSDLERDKFFDRCAEFAKQDIIGVATETDSNSASLHAKTATLRQLQLRDVQSVRCWTAFPDRFFRQFDEKTLKHMVDESRIPQILACEPPVVAKAAAIRKTLHKQLGIQFDTKISKLGGGNWLCSGRFDSTEFELHLDYGAMGPGFRYGVSLGLSPAAAVPGGLGFHSPYGIPARAIDFTMADELEQLSTVFCEGITDLVNTYTMAPGHCDPE